jgi:hypothetical protein
MAEVKTAETPQKKAKKQLEEVHITRGKNGGHVVKHVYGFKGSTSEPWQANEEEEHIFGKEDGEELLAHLKKHMKIKGEDESNEMEDEKDDSGKGNAKHKEREHASVNTDEEEEEPDQKEEEGDK